MLRCALVRSFVRFCLHVYEYMLLLLQIIKDYQKQSLLIKLFIQCMPHGNQFITPDVKTLTYASRSIYRTYRITDITPLWLYGQSIFDKKKTKQNNQRIATTKPAFSMDFCQYINMIRNECSHWFAANTSIAFLSIHFVNFIEIVAAHFWPLH